MNIFSIVQILSYSYNYMNKMQYMHFYVLFYEELYRKPNVFNRIFVSIPEENGRRVPDKEGSDWFA